MTRIFRPLTIDDLPLLHEWLHRPHVRQWWKAPCTLMELQNEYLNDSSTKGYIALLEDVPIGFIQSYVVQGSGEGWWEDESDPGARGIDQFLANEYQLGQGLGRAMIRAFIDELFKDPHVTTVQVDPSPDNERAIRCYHRAGFGAIRTVETPDGPALLMRIGRGTQSTQGKRKP